MEQMGIPSQTILIVQSIIIFFMAAERGISESSWVRRVYSAALRRLEGRGRS